MSGKVSGWAWDQELSIHLKYVLLAYADKADHYGKDVYPSIRLICEMTCLSRRSVQRNTRELETLGYLIPDGKGPKGVNKWRIPVDKGVTPATPPTVKGDTDDIERVTPMTRGGDMGDAKGVTPASLNPPLNPSIETSVKPSKERRANARGPAVILIRRINHINPSGELNGLIDRVVGTEFIDLLKWGRIIRKWNASGWNKTNYHGMLDVFKNGWEREKISGELSDEDRRKKYTKGWFDV